MHKRSQHLAALVSLLLLAVLLVACFPRQPPSEYGTAWGDGAFRSNGERIYFTTTSEGGDPITYTGGPDLGGMMMGGRLTCASCHGPSARGGRHIMHMQAMDAPAIRGPALAEEEHEEEGEHGGEYDLETFRLAVVEGKHPNGEPLNADMPRWSMSDEDLSDLFDYLMSLP
jgi:hypothetical protein